jgi:hypothetical protein
MADTTTASRPTMGSSVGVGSATGGSSFGAGSHPTGASTGVGSATGTSSFGGGSSTGLDHSEGTVARTIEQQTARLPSDLFLWAAGASIVGSLLLHCSNRKEDANFVGQWAPTFLLLGLYNKLVKVAGSDPAR